MKPFLLLCLALLINVYSICQGQTSINGGQNLQGLNGAPLTPDRVSEMVGTYFYKTEYLPAILVDVSGKEFKDLKVKLNQQTNAIYYLGKDGQEMESISDIRKIIFIEGDKMVLFENFFPAMGALNAGSFYQVIINGKAKLLSSTQFSEVEYKEFNSAVTTKRADKVHQLYAFANRTMIKLSKGDTEIIGLLKDKSTEVEAFIKQQGLKCKKQSDYETVFNYYNSLK
jgi:hypothetical protein